MDSWAQAIESGWTLVDGRGRQPRGLQNRLRGAAEASWVGSIPIHPRHFSAVVTAKVTATAADIRARQGIVSRGALSHLGDREPQPSLNVFLKTLSSACVGRSWITG
jgi:hypothetical protein